MSRFIIIFLIALLLVGGLAYILWGVEKEELSPEPELSSSQPEENLLKEVNEKVNEEVNEKVNKVNQEKSMVQAPQTIELEAGKKYSALLKTTEGNIKIELNTEQTPGTAYNFIYLTRLGFYDDTIFHRVIKGFMIQGGDPRGDGTGGPGYKFADEPFEGSYSRGTVAMANSGPNTNGSQFFVMHQDYPLPPNYVIFGEVVEGIEVVDKIAEAPVRPGAGGEASTPVSPVKVNSVEVMEE